MALNSFVRRVSVSLLPIRSVGSPKAFKEAISAGGHLVGRQFLQFSSSFDSRSRSPNSTQFPPEKEEKDHVFSGCDLKHWFTYMDKPDGEGATKKQMMEIYLETLSQIVGSKSQAKKKIYSVSFDAYFGFGCALDESAALKLEDVPGVLFVVPDSYADPNNRDYGGELYGNGTIIQKKN